MKRNVSVAVPAPLNIGVTGILPPEKVADNPMAVPSPSPTILSAGLLPNKLNCAVDKPCKNCFKGPGAQAATSEACVSCGESEDASVFVIVKRIALGVVAGVPEIAVGMCQILTKGLEVWG